MYRSALFALRTIRWTLWQLSIRASMSSENISSSRAPGSVCDARTGRRLRWTAMPSIFRRITFFRRIHREDGGHASEAGVGSGSIFTMGALMAPRSDIAEHVGERAPRSDDEDDDVVDEAGEGALARGGASMPLEMESSRAARVWWTQ